MSNSRLSLSTLSPSKKKLLMFAGPIAVLLLGGWAYFLGGRYVTTDNAYLKADKLSISAEITGRVTEIHVENNAHVAKDQLLFRIDPEPFAIAVKHAEANLLNARSSIESMKADYLKERAEVQKASDTLRYQEKEYERYKALSAQKAAPLARFDEVTNDRDTAKGELESAKQALASLNATLGDPTQPLEEHPTYKQALAELEKARLDASHVEIKAPSDGTVANVTMQPGEYIMAGLPLFSLVKEKHRWIEANFKETDLTYVRAGQNAEIEVDTFSGKTWHAKVVSITPATGAEFSVLPAENSSGNWVKVVQRIMVRLELTDDDGSLPLSAGMSSYVKIDTGHTRLGRIFGAAL